MDDTERAIWSRIADSLERLADHFCPVEEKREKRPAVLSKASYTREDKEWKEFRQGETPKSAGRTSESPRPDPRTGL